VIDVFIRRLRRKVDDGEDQKLLRTRRGAGYALSADPEGPARTDETKDD
jgi:two-component system OmpR family response regulator